MKKILFALTLISVLFTMSCKKGIYGAGSWSFAGTNYNVSNTTWSAADHSLTASNGANNPSTLSIYFPSNTVTSGSYKVVNYTQVPLDSGQVYIKFINDIGSYYYFSTGNDNVYAKVSVSSAGKISVNVPALFLESYSSPMPDSAQLTATVNQQ